MRKHIHLTCLTISTLLLAAASTATGQLYQPFGETDIHYDMQWFAPPIIDEYGDEPVAPNYGFFADYSRTMIRLNRPENVSSSFQEDRTWGNIWDLGYMTEDNHGWLMSILQFNSTNVAQLTNVTDIQGNTFTLQNNLNYGQYSGVELNKTFRVHVGAHGAYFEPFGGLRYGAFEEKLQNESLVFDNPANPLLETGTSVVGAYHNTMFGGQLGMRSYLRSGHWVVSSEIRGFGLMNFQEVSVVQTQIITTADGAGGFVVQNPTTTRSDQSYDEFVVGGELRLEAAYELTREIRAHAGMELLQFGRGIGRGINTTTLSAAQDNDQAVTYFGFFFGFELNR